nr:pentatricopeptide repeat protein AaPPR1287 [Agave angustifolia]
MVTGFAHNGLGMQSLDVFERMIKAGARPTHITFLGVLAACSHAGLVSEGRRFLNSMEKDYGVCPSIEHYAAFIDALGRKRQLAEAAELIESLPTRNAGIWGALLGACQVHGDLDVGKRAAEALFSLEPNNGVRYVTLSNIYAAAGQWDEAKRIRVTMKKKGLKKDAGYSWIEVRSVKHVFGAEDKSHYRTKEIYGMLHAVVEQMMEERTGMQSFSFS